MTKLVKVVIQLTVDPIEWCSSPNYTALQNCVLSMSNLSGPYKINEEALRTFEVTSVEVIENGN
jgi:hypothetical protein